MSGWGLKSFRSWRLLVAALICLAPATASSQNLMAPQAALPVPPTAGSGPPGAPGATIMSPVPLGPPSPLSPSGAQGSPIVPAGHVALAVAARYGRDAPAISGGLIWRVYSAKADTTGVFRLIKEDRGAAPTFILPPGSYVVHASLGLASAAKAIQLRADTVREMFDIPAGGVRLEGRVGDVRIPPGQIAFDVFPGSQFDTSNRRPVAQNVMTGDVVLLPEGTYYIVSNYGEANSVVRSDVRVQAAKLTDIVVTHRAAAL